MLARNAVVECSSPDTEEVGHMRMTYKVLAYLIAAGVALQAAIIAYAWFATLKDLNSGAVIDKSYDGNAGDMLHGQIGMLVLPILVVLLLIVSFFAGIPGGVRYAAIILGLTVLQIGFAFGGFAAPIVGALHGLNAIALFVIAHRAAHRVETAAPAQAPTAEPTASPVSQV
jgi:hypothetical protein